MQLTIPGQLDVSGVSLYGNLAVQIGHTAHLAWTHTVSTAQRFTLYQLHLAPNVGNVRAVSEWLDSPWLTNPAAPLTGYPHIYGDVGTPRSLRTRLGLTLIDQRLHGSDGLGAAGFTLSSLRQAELSDRNLSGELAREATFALCRAYPVLTASNGQAVDVSAACPVRAGWDLRGDPGSRGAVLWRQFWAQALQATDLWSVPFDATHPATTPLLDDDGQFAAVTFGSSFIMTVDLAPSGPTAYTILTYSESANPSSPHHSDQTALFAQKRWVTDRFTEHEINTDPQLQVTVVTG